MPSIDCQAILFDLDGTLVDSAACIQRLWAWWGGLHGIAYETIAGVMHGKRSVETIRLVAPHLDAQRESVMLEASELNALDEVRVYPGVGELLRGLPTGSWAIVTSGSRPIAEGRLRHFGLPVPEVFITADDVAAGKPAPDGYLLAAGGLGARPARCVVVEDSPVGVQAGKAAGMTVVGLTTTHRANELTEADVVIREVGELMAAVRPDGLRLTAGQ